jgi:hypothetical protein
VKISDVRYNLQQNVSFCIIFNIRIRILGCLHFTLDSDLDPDPDPDPALFVSGFQHANKEFFLLQLFAYYRLWRYGTYFFSL